MNSPYLIAVEMPHSWSNGYNLTAQTEEDAEAIAADIAKGSPGNEGYTQVSIYSLVRKVN